MGAVSYTLSAHRRNVPDDRGLHAKRLPRARLNDAIRWALNNGCDTLIINVHCDVSPFDADIVHHACTDPHCPGGCA